MRSLNFHFLLLAPFLLWNTAADHIVEPDHHNIADLVCDLECHNNGVCRYLTKDAHELQRKIQSGLMVQQCVCPLGYRGMSCDVKVVYDPEHCRGKDAASPRCQCAAADSLSVFAGEQCRRPFTEFCASLSNSVGGHISYCTNGGKCKGDLIAAERSPGNTDNNYLFQHAGCVCPPEFKGEHCELLNQRFHGQPHSNTGSQQSGEGGGKEGVAILVVCMGALGVMALVLIRKVRRNRSNNTLQGLPRPPTQMALNRYSDNIFEDAHDEHEGGPLPEVA